MRNFTNKMFIIMKKITIEELKRAIVHVDRGNSSIQNLGDVPDEAFFNYDLVRDLRIGNIRLTNVINELHRHHDFDLPIDIFRKMPDDKVKTLMDTINNYLKETEQD